MDDEILINKRGLQNSDTELSIPQYHSKPLTPKEMLYGFEITRPVSIEIKEYIEAEFAKIR